MARVLARRLMSTAGYLLLTASASPSSVSGSDSSSSVGSSSTTVTVAGGSGFVTHSWARVSGDSSITASNPSGATCSFSASGMSYGSIGATFRDTITDTVTGETKTVDVSVSLTRNAPALNISASGSGDASVNSSTAVTVTGGWIGIDINSGVAPFSYDFAKTGPPGDVSEMQASGNQARFVRSLGPGESVSPQGRCTVTDGLGRTDTVFFSATLSNTGSAPPAFSVSADTPVDGSSNTGFVVTNSSTATPTGAVGAVTWSWSKLSGSGSADSSSSASTTFSASVPYTGNESGTFRVTGTDSLGRTAFADVTAIFYNFFIGGG